MMYKKIVSFIIVFLFLFFLIPRAYCAEKMNILLVYDRVNYYGEQINQVASLKKLLSNFSNSVITIKEDYYYHGLSDNYDCLVYLGLQGNTSSTALLQDLGAKKKKTIYIGKGIDEYLAAFPVTFLTYNGDNTQATKIFYQNQIFNLDFPYQFSLLQTEQAKIYGKITDGKNYWPYALNWDNFYYISGYKANTALASLLNDLLKDVLENYNSSSYTQAVKISEEKLQDKSLMHILWISSMNLFIVFVALICLAFLVILTRTRFKNKKNIFLKVN